MIENDSISIAIGGSIYGYGHLKRTLISFSSLFFFIPIIPIFGLDPIIKSLNLFCLNQFIISYS